jgi:hypothetical protein
MIGARPAIENIDSWTLPDGTLGDGASQAVTMWAHTWLAEE